LDCTGVDWYDLSYRNWCVAQGAMKQTAGIMSDILGINATSSEVPGKAGPLRIAEGVDSIHNIVNSANAETASAASAYLMCSITQAGGLLYTFLALVIVSFVMVLAPLANWSAQFAYDSFVLLSSIRANADVQQQCAASASGPRLADLCGKRAVTVSAYRPCARAEQPDASDASDASDDER